MNRDKAVIEREKVLTHVSDVIRIASREIKRLKTVESDQMRQLSALLKAFTRLSGAT